MTDDQNTASAETVPELLARARRAWTVAGFRTGEFAEALDLAGTARERAHLAGDRLGEAEATVLLGLVRHYQSITIILAGGTVEDAAVAAEEELFRDGVAMAEALGAHACAAVALFGLGLVEQVFHEDWNQAMPYYRRAETLIPALEASGDRYTQSEIHRHIGFHYLVADEQPALALEHLRISLDLRLADGEPLRIPSGRIALGWAERAAGDLPRAVRTLRTAVRESRAAGLLPARIEDAERALREAEQALPEAGPAA